MDAPLPVPDASLRRLEAPVPPRRQIPGDHRRISEARAGAIGIRNPAVQRNQVPDEDATPAGDDPTLPGGIHRPVGAVRRGRHGVRDAAHRAGVRTIGRADGLAVACPRPRLWVAPVLSATARVAPVGLAGPVGVVGSAGLVGSAGRSGPDGPEVRRDLRVRPGTGRDSAETLAVRAHPACRSACGHRD